MSAFSTVLVFTSEELVDPGWPSEVLPLSMGGLEHPATRGPKKPVPDLLHLGCNELVSLTGTGGGLLLLGGLRALDPAVATWWTSAAQAHGLMRGEWAVPDDARARTYSLRYLSGDLDPWEGAALPDPDLSRVPRPQSRRWWWWA